MDQKPVGPPNTIVNVKMSIYTKAFVSSILTVLSIAAFFCLMYYFPIFTVTFMLCAGIYIIWLNVYKIKQENEEFDIEAWVEDLKKELYNEKKE